MDKETELKIFKSYSVQRQADKLAYDLLSDRNVESSIICKFDQEDQKLGSVIVGRRLYLYLQVSIIPIFSLGLLSIAEPTRKFTLTKRVLMSFIGNGPIYLICRQSYLQHYMNLKENLKKKYLIRGDEKIYK